MSRRETTVTSTELEKRHRHRRAVQSVIWGLPAVNYRLMLDAAVRAGMTQPNGLVLWPGLFDWHNQTLTPNPDVVYVLAFHDTTAGPVVLDVPPSAESTINGSVMNCWQAPFEDVGVAGVDAGAGARYLILPPGWTDPVPDGFVVLPSDTRRGYSLIRFIPAGNTDQDVAAAVACARRLRIHRLHEDPPATAFVEIGDDELFDAAVPYDARFFEVLDSVIQVEPWLERDRVMIDQLRTLGLERGRRFEPGADLRAILDDAAREAHDLLDTWYEQENHPFADTARWGVPVRPEYLQATATGFAGPDGYAVDARAITFTFGFFSARHLGQGQFYLAGIADEDGRPLDGGGTYTLHIPPDAPVSQYWSATVYDRETHTLLRGVDRPSRSSLSPELVPNADGSVDLVLGPEAPPAASGNWIPTLPGRRFEILMRFYGPTAALFDKTWRLPDVRAS